MMEQNLVCAIIEDNHVITLKVYEDLNEVQLNYNQAAVDCTMIPCTIGDIYMNGSFYKHNNGKEVLINPIPDYSEQIEKIQNDNHVLINALADTLGGVEL